MQLLRRLWPAASPRWPMLTGFVVFSFVGAFVFMDNNPGESRGQPIAFNHSKHIENGMQCSDCHQGVESQAHATIPTLEMCLDCHEEALAKGAEEEKIRNFAAEGKQLDWNPVTRIPTHAYFSHRRHVRLAELECATCHGPMEKATVPPRRPFRLLDMEACIECHEQSGANTDCNDCHR